MPSHDLIHRYGTWARSEGHADSTISDRLRILTRLDEELPYGADYASEDDLRDWLWRDRSGQTKTGRDWSVGTRETYHGAVAHFYHWAAEVIQELEFNPAADIPRPEPEERLPNPVTDEQLQAALDRACEPYLTWIKLAAYAGLRCIDIAQLHRERVTQQTVKVLASKGGAARIIPTHPIIWDALATLPPGPVTGHDRRQISMRSWVYFHRTLKLNGVRMHRFRHWFGTQVQRQYRDLLVTQQLLGHKNPKTTAGYALVVAEQKREAIDLLPVFAGVPLGELTVG